jgi:hypothetical protein
MSISPVDHAAILDLISQYAYTYDEDRIDDMVDLFVDDAHWSICLAGSETPTMEASSNEERRCLFQEVRSGCINEAGMPRHFQTNTILKPLSDNRVAGRTMVLGTQQPYDGSQSRILFSGVYEDEFVMSNSRWRFTRRQGRLDASSL